MNLNIFSQKLKLLVFIYFGFLAWEPPDHPLHRYSKAIKKIQKAL